MSDPNVMTACENVCRDFSWMGPLSSWATFLGALVASLTAIYIARDVYAHQKKQDRILALRAERREAYRRFVTAIISYREGVIDLRDHLEPAKSFQSVGMNEFVDKFGRIYSKLSLELNLLELTAEREIYLECQRTVAALAENLSSSRAELDRSRTHYTVTEVIELLESKLKLTIERINESLPTIVAKMRETEFSEVEAKVEM